MDRDIYSKLIAKLKSVGTALSGVETDTTQLKEDVTALQSAVTTLQGVTAVTLAENLIPSAENLETLPYNYVFKIGSLVVYHIAIRLKGTVEVPFAKNTWFDIMNIPAGFYMATADQVPAINLVSCKTDASAYYNNSAHKLQLRLENDINTQQGYEFLMVGRIAT